jgi:hypothetical protein
LSTTLSIPLVSLNLCRLMLRCTTLHYFALLCTSLH